MGTDWKWLLNGWQGPWTALRGKPCPPPSEAVDRPSQVLAATLTSFLLAAALARSNGLYNERSFWMVTQGFALFTLSWVLPYRPWFEKWCRATIPIVLSVILLWELIMLFQIRPLLYGNWQHADELQPFYGLSLAMVVTAFLSLLSQKTLYRRFSFVLLLCCLTLLGAWTIASSPLTHFPSQRQQQYGAQRVWQGENPYQSSDPDKNMGAGPWNPSLQGEDILPQADQRLAPEYLVYHDMPYILWCCAVAELGLGDHRYAVLWAWLLFASLLFAAAPSRALVAVALLWLMPRGLFLLEQGWVEPLIFLPMLAMILSRHTLVWPLFAAWFFTSKQDLILFLPLLRLLMPQGQRFPKILYQMGWVILGSLVLLLPYGYADAYALYQATWLYLWQQPFHADALNLNAWWSTLYGTTWPPTLGMVFCLLGQGVVLLWGPKSPAGFCFGLAWSLLFWLSFHPQAFANYYHFVLGCFAAGITLATFQPMASEQQHVSNPHLSPRPTIAPIV